MILKSPVLSYKPENPGEFSTDSHSLDKAQNTTLDTHPSCNKLQLFFL